MEGKDLFRKNPIPKVRHQSITAPATSCAASVVAASVVASKPTDFLHETPLKSSGNPVGPWPLVIDEVTWPLSKWP